jgi:F-type H+-transporting ATPase subunit gamma
MATLRQIRRRIRSVRSTMQITTAMEMLSAAKLRKAQAQAHASRAYAGATEGILARVAGDSALREHPAFAIRPPQRVLLAVVASDRGLCGGFNANVLAAAEARRRALAPARVETLPIGRRAVHALGGAPAFGIAPVARLEDRAVVGIALELAREVSALFTAGRVDRVEFIYTCFLSTTRRVVETRAVVPVGGPAPGRDAPDILEPDAPHLIQALLPRYANARILAILAGSLASEHSARMLAMGNATRNAIDMIETLTLTANKVRQAAITKELLEIVGGGAGIA